MKSKFTSNPVDTALGFCIALAFVACAVDIVATSHADVNSSWVNEKTTAELSKKIIPMVKKTCQDGEFSCRGDATRKAVDAVMIDGEGYNQGKRSWIKNQIEQEIIFERTQKMLYDVNMTYLVIEDHNKTYIGAYETDDLCKDAQNEIGDTSKSTMTVSCVTGSQMKQK